ncbi:PepSY domain-containing protein [uncultured Thiothrix sp.]|uniref:PepSY domain-containing protein n=1 Tax=uncultured Thiothrix sp. TaxID=223185 RepID=UPI002636FE7B|nr:PepSY domain-containing protein [uncultured Thiothrix sp.]
MKKQVLLSLVAMTALFAQAAFAEPTCTKEPKDKWMSELDAQKKIVGEMGYVIYKFKESEQACYEIYGMGAKEGGAAGEMEKVEIYFNPVDMSITEKKKD